MITEPFEKNKRTVFRKSSLPFVSILEKNGTISISNFLSNKIGLKKNDMVFFSELEFDGKRFFAFAVTINKNYGFKLRKNGHNPLLTSSRELARRLLEYHNFSKEERDSTVRLLCDYTRTYKVTYQGEMLDFYPIYRFDKPDSDASDTEE